MTEREYILLDEVCGSAATILVERLAEGVTAVEAELLIYTTVEAAVLAFRKFGAERRVVPEPSVN